MRGGSGVWDMDAGSQFRVDCVEEARMQAAKEMQAAEKMVKDDAPKLGSLPACRIHVCDRLGITYVAFEVLLLVCVAPMMEGETCCRPPLLVSWWRHPRIVMFATKPCVASSNTLAALML